MLQSHHNNWCYLSNMILIWSFILCCSCSSFPCIWWFCNITRSIIISFAFKLAFVSSSIISLSSLHCYFSVSFTTITFASSLLLFMDMLHLCFRLRPSTCIDWSKLWTRCSLLYFNLQQKESVHFIGLKTIAKHFTGLHLTNINKYVIISLTLDCQPIANLSSAQQI